MNEYDIKPGAFVRVLKRREASNPRTPAGSWETWIAGGDNRLSLPIDYELAGFLIEEVQPGRPMRIRRLWRNGVKADGLFVSTEVSSVTPIPEGGLLITTANSVYTMELCSLPSSQD